MVVYIIISGACTKEEVDAVRVGTGMTTLSSSITAKASLHLGAGTKVDGPPREGPTWGFLAIAFFSFEVPPSAMAIFQLAFFMASSETFIYAKSK